MLNQPTFEKLVQMRLSAMALAFRQKTEDPGMAGLSFEVPTFFSPGTFLSKGHQQQKNQNQAAVCPPNIAPVSWTSGQWATCLQLLVRGAGTPIFLHTPR